MKRLFDVLGELLDDRVGIIGHLGECPREAGAPDFFHFYAEACNTGAFSRQRNFSNTGGASADRKTAMAKAIGEAVERYCSACYEPEEYPLATIRSAPFRCVDPDDFALFSREQFAQPDFPYVSFTLHTRVRLAQMIDPLTDESWYVPAAMVFNPYICDLDDEESSIVQPISTGLACHCSWAEAATSAICEVVERDAFTITWQARLGMPRICQDTLSERNRSLMERFERGAGSITLLNLTLDHGIPTILSVLKSQASDAPALVFAASSDLNPEHAVRKSLEELAHTRRLAQYLKTAQPSLASTLHYENVRDQAHHVRLYCDPQNAYLAEFIFSSEEEVSFSEIDNLATADPEQDLYSLLMRIKKVNHRVLLTNLTTTDVRPLGLTVIRAVIPGFHPLFMGYRRRALGGERLWHVPQKLGYKGISRETGDNLAPHPYP